MGKSVQWAQDKLFLLETGIMVGNAAATAAAVVDDVVGKVATVNVTVGTDCHTREFQLQTVLIGDHCQNLAIWICGIIENDDIIMPFVRIPFLRAKDKLHSFVSIDHATTRGRIFQVMFGDS